MRIVHHMLTIKENASAFSSNENTGAPSASWPRWVGLILATLFVFLGLGGSAVPADMQRARSLDAVVQGWQWDPITWELDAISQKIVTQFVAPVQALTARQQVQVVKDYMQRAQTIAELEDRINAVYADPVADDAKLLSQLVSTLDFARTQQHLVRRSAEQVIEQQIGQELADAGLRVGPFTFPPVLFTFSEAPRKLVVSPRPRIDTTYYAMLAPDLPAANREEIEQTVLTDHDLSAYVANIGGLGVYPTLVIDSAPLPWVLSTVAHEWTHNYLTLFPLGVNYGASAEINILNETIADIVGDEIGWRALHTYYPNLAHQFTGKD
jgi:hypothetical protein